MPAEFLTIDDGPSARRLEIQWHNRHFQAKPVLIFLHEGLGCVRLWKDLPEQLSQQTQCPALAYSRPGYGRSGTAALPRKINFMHTEALAVLPKLISAARIQHYILIGHSDGGSISLIHGGSGKARGLDGIITLAAHIFCEPVTLDSIRAAKARYLTGDLKQRLAAFHGPNTDTAFWGWNDTWLLPKFIHWNIEKFLKHIQVPVLGIQGSQDPYGTDEQLLRLSAKIPDCRPFFVDNCGHAPHVQQPSQVIQAMADFIRLRLCP